MNKTVLVNAGYIGDGVYLLECSACTNQLETTVRLSDYSPKMGLNPKPPELSINYCWACGVKFDLIEV